MLADCPWLSLQQVAQLYGDIWLAAEFFMQKEIRQKICNFQAAFPTRHPRWVSALQTEHSTAGEIPSFPPALAELSLKIISKNTGAVFTIAGHSGISPCFRGLSQTLF